jgi:hypothetical protein
MKRSFLIVAIGDLRECIIIIIIIIIKIIMF